MTRRAVPMSALILLLLSGCDRDSGGGAVPAAQSGATPANSAAVPDDLRFEPGRWSATIRVEHISAPRMPPQMAADMKAMFAGLEPAVSCLTAAEAKKPAAEFFLGENRNKCAYDRFEMNDGVIDARLSCARDGARQTMTLQGSYSPDTYQLLATTNTQGADRPDLGSLTMKMVIAAKRTGQCDGSESKF